MKPFVVREVTSFGYTVVKTGWDYPTVIGFEWIAAYMSERLTDMPPIALWRSSVGVEMG